MEDWVFQMFRQELEKLCKFANQAFEDLQQGLKSSDKYLLVWGSVHSFLVATANISKIFWPKPRYSKRGDELRKKFSIDDNSPLKERASRNYLEHFDEYLEKWVETTKTRRYFDLSWGSLKGAKEKHPDLDRKDILRFVDTDTLTIIFREDTYEIKRIHDSINELLGKVRG